MSGSPASGGDARIEATIEGVVQGVGFRWFVWRTAARLDVRGWVANRSDGGVELVAEGSSPALEALVSAVRRGPPGAVVSSVQVHYLPSTGRFRDFEIRGGGHSGD
jgi:acylphosphatase